MPKNSCIEEIRTLGNKYGEKISTILGASKKTSWMDNCEILHSSNLNEWNKLVNYFIKDDFKNALLQIFNNDPTLKKEWNQKKIHQKLIEQYPQFHNISQTQVKKKMLHLNDKTILPKILNLTDDDGGYIPPHFIIIKSCLYNTNEACSDITRDNPDTTKNNLKCNNPCGSKYIKHPLCSTAYNCCTVDSDEVLYCSKCDSFRQGKFAFNLLEIIRQMAVLKCNPNALLWNPIIQEPFKNEELEEFQVLFDSALKEFSKEGTIEEITMRYGTQLWLASMAAGAAGAAASIVSPVGVVGITLGLTAELFTLLSTGALVSSSAASFWIEYNKSNKDAFISSIRESLIHAAAPILNNWIHEIDAMVITDLLRRGLDYKKSLNVDKVSLHLQDIDNLINNEFKDPEINLEIKKHIGSGFFPLDRFLTLHEINKEGIFDADLNTLICLQQDYNSKFIPFSDILVQSKHTDKVNQLLNDLCNNIPLGGFKQLKYKKTNKSRYKRKHTYKKTLKLKNKRSKS